MVLEDLVLLLRGVVHSCQCKEVPLAGMQPIKVVFAITLQLSLLSVARR